jgi:nucleotide-binding universal stress UspA family protein
MTFKNILVALDGSSSSQLAADYGFWLATNLGASLSAQHVVDPRLVDLFVEPEFGEELGFGYSVDTSEKIFNALRKIGAVILNLFATEAAGRGLKTTTFLDEGYVAEEIVKYGDQFDLLVIGHRGKGKRPLPARMMLGSMAERVAINAGVPVLIARQPVDRIKQILVAYDGSEPARGALLMAEDLAKNTGARLKAVTIVNSDQNKAEAKFLVEEGERFLRGYSEKDVFSIEEGAITNTLLGYADDTNSLLVLGAYGFKDADCNVLGSTTTAVIRQAKSSVLIFRPKHVHKKAKTRELLKEVARS